MTTSFSLAHLSRPPVERAEGRPPALVLLHGYGSNEQDLMGLAPYLDPTLHILSPRAPIPMGMGMHAWYSLDFLPNGDFLISEPEMRRSLELVEQFLEEAVAAYELDPERLFLGGFSQGAIQSVATLLRQPDRVAGVLAMSGRWPGPVEEERAPDERLDGKPVVAVHGLYDEVIPIRYGRELRDRLAELPVDLTYEEFPMAHQVSAESLDLIRRWLGERLADEG